MTIAQITSLFQSAQAAANAVPVVGLNPYAQIGFLAGNAILGLVSRLDQNSEVPRPASFSVEEWEALKVFTKTGTDYLNEARKLNPVDPSKILSPNP